MALTASPPPANLPPEHQDLSDRLDEDIALIRAEIASLTKRKNLLTSSLLSSTKIQNRLNAQNNNFPNDTPTDLTPLHAQAQHNETNIHRLAYGVTSFPFTDPNPDTSDRPLLGVRFDIPSRSGKFEQAPYYIFLKRIAEDTSLNTDAVTNPNNYNNNDLRIHHHTIPAFVPLQDYEAQFLPQTPNPNSESPNNSIENQSRQRQQHSSPSPANGNDDSMPQDQPIPSVTSTQDLHGLVVSVRRDLTSWQLRHDAMTLLAEQLDVEDTGDGDNEGKFSLQSLQATAADARFCRLVWQNGTVARLRLTDDGHVDRAVVIGDLLEKGEPGRLKDIERVLCTSKDGSKLSCMNLVERLEEVEKRMDKMIERQETSNQHNDNMQLDHSISAN